MNLFIAFIASVVCFSSHSYATQVGSGSRSESGIPSIYFIRSYDVTVQNCDDDQLYFIRFSDHVASYYLCKQDFFSCVMEGTCLIKNHGVNTLLNYSGKVDGKYYFTELTSGLCPYGLGSTDHICLDPFNSVAADSALYKSGQVIYVPKIKGTVLPNGQIHDGYLIIRDSSPLIKGPGRFDFFTADKSDTDFAGNPFAKLKLGDNDVKFEYYDVKEPKASQIRTAKNYPGVSYGRNKSCSSLFE